MKALLLTNPYLKPWSRRYDLSFSDTLPQKTVYTINKVNGVLATGKNIWWFIAFLLLFCVAPTARSYEDGTSV